jgi:hypothetical protein
MMSNEFRPAVSNEWARKAADYLLGYSEQLNSSINQCCDRSQLSRLIAPRLARKMGLERARKEEIKAVVDQLIIAIGSQMPVSESARQCGGLSVNVDAINVIMSNQCVDAVCVNEESANAMSQTNAIAIKTVTYVNGRDVKSLSNDQVYDLITSETARIATLEALPIKPKALAKEVALSLILI